MSGIDFERLAEPDKHIRRDELLRTMSDNLNEAITRGGVLAQLIEPAAVKTAQQNEYGPAELACALVAVMVPLLISKARYGIDSATGEKVTDPKSMLQGIEFQMHAIVQLTMARVFNAMKDDPAVTAKFTAIFDTLRKVRDDD